MHRWYRSAHYAERVRVIRRVMPNAAIGADVIVGFPGETDEDFRETIEFDRRSSVYLFARFFVFQRVPEPPAPHSATPCRRVRSANEPARCARWRGKSPTEFRSSQSGRVLRALTLARSGDAWTEAITGNYLKLRIPGRHAANRWLDVRLGAEGSVEEIQNGLCRSAFENHLGERQISAVRDGYLKYSSRPCAPQSEARLQPDVRWACPSLHG